MGAHGVGRDETDTTGAERRWILRRVVGREGAGREEGEEGGRAFKDLGQHGAMTRICR